MLVWREENREMNFEMKDLRERNMRERRENLVLEKDVNFLCCLWRKMRTFSVICIVFEPKQ